LEGFASAKGLTAERARTITTAFDTVVRRDGAIDPGVVQQKIKETSDALGIVRHLVTLYLNEKALADPSCPYLCDRTAYGRLCSQLARIPSEKGGTVQDPFLEAYLQRHPLPAPVKAIIDRGFCPNARYGMCTEMVTAAERHLKDGFIDRVTQHIACDLERRLWHRREQPGFDKFVKRAAKVVLQAAQKNEDAAAISRLEDYIINSSEIVVNDVGGTKVTYMANRDADGHMVFNQDCIDALFDAANDYRQDLASLRVPAPPTNRRVSDSCNFNYNCKNPALLLPVLGRYREQDAQYR
jgi:hypothetical protein